MQLVGNFLQAGLGARQQDLRKTAICSSLNAGGLLPALRYGAVLPSECLVAMACSLHIEIACRNFVVDFVYTLLDK